MPIAEARRRFGPYELDSRIGELRTNGTRIKLQGQPISVLEILLETPGELVTREQIRERLWSSDTFVDFDHNLNTAIKKLRHALGDEAETPRYIETIPRYGYRFIGEVEKDAVSGMVTPPAEPASAEPASTGPEKPSLLRRALPWALGATTILCAAIATWFALKPAPLPEVIRFSIPPPENAEFFSGGGMSLSPDGHTLAFTARPDPTKPQVLRLRPLDSLTAQQVPGTAGAALPFWSPDGRQIGFAAGGKLEKAAVSGGPPEILCDANISGATWNRGGVILFSSGGNLYTVPDTGGTPTLLLAPDSSHQEIFLRFPQFLPDGRHFIFQVVLSIGNSFLVVSSLDSKVTERLMPAESQAIYAEPGYLVYTSQGSLVARPFGAKALHFMGPAMPLVQGVGRLAYYRYSFFSVSPAGILAYQPGQYFETSQMTWFDRAGKKLGTVGQPGIYTAPAISPDGSKLGVSAGESGKRDIWIYDLKRGTASRLTFDSADDTSTVWSPDGSRIVFASNRDGVFDPYQQAANGLGGAEPLFQSKLQNVRINDVTSDGRYLIYDTASPSGGGASGLWVLPLFGDRKPYHFVQASNCCKSATFSPNGRFVAYTSAETGRYEVYVETFPQQTGKWQISPSGGNVPMWRRDGKELFFLGLDGKLMAVDVNTTGATFEAGIPKPLFQTQLNGGAAGRNFYVVAPDGRRFLMLVPVEPNNAEPITVVVNWPALLKK